MRHEGPVSRRDAAVGVFAAGALWGVLFAVGFTQYTSNASVLATGLGGLGLLGVWSARRRFLHDTSLLARWGRWLHTVSHDLVAFAVVNMTGRQVRDFISSHWNLHPSPTLVTLGVALIATLTWWLSNRVLWRVIEASLYAALFVSAWTAYVVLRHGGYDGNHLATVVGSGSSSAMVLRGVAVAVVSYVVVDLVVSRWSDARATTLSVVRPAIVLVTLLAMGLSYVVVTGAGTFTSNIPFTFAGVASTYGGHGLQSACELLYVELLLISSVVLLRDVRDSRVAGVSFAGGVSSASAWALRSAGVLLIVSLPLGIAESFQLGVMVALVGWFVVALRAMLRVSRDGEAWYEWFPPVVAAAVTSLGLYGAVNRSLSWDGHGASQHVTQTILVVAAVTAAFYYLVVRRDGRQGPGAISLDE